MNKSKLKAELENMRANILERRARITQIREEPIPQDFEDQATEVENDETKVALARELNIELQNVEHALQRLEEGIYSICATCSADINPERSLALPSTTLCINCAK